MEYCIVAHLTHIVVGISSAHPWNLPFIDRKLSFLSHRLELSRLSRVFLSARKRNGTRFREKSLHEKEEESCTRVKSGADASNPLNTLSFFSLGGIFRSFPRRAFSLQLSTINNKESSYKSQHQPLHFPCNIFLLIFHPFFFLFLGK